MAKTKISEFSSTPANNTDIDGINIAEGCAPSGINDAIRELMAQLKDFQAGTAGDSFNGPVGTTTAAAIAATTLTTSSTVTHNGGTANGVAYLNGSKVLTTGSALTFDGTTFAGQAFSATGITNNVNLLSLKDSGTSYTNGNNFAYLTNSTNAVVGAIYHPEVTSLGVSGNTALIFGIGATPSEQMRLTSTGLGIGTSSPGSKLDISNTARIQLKASSSTSAIELWKDATPTFAASIGPGTATGLASALKFDIYNGSAWSTAATIDASGNLGLGVTPSANWRSTAKALQVNGFASIIGYSNPVLRIATNAVFGASNETYGVTGQAATYYEQNNGQHSWYTAPSGTAGNAISFTQAMTLDASGNLLVGGTSAPLASAGRGNITVNGSTDAIVNLTSSGTSRAWFFATSTNAYLSAASGIPIIFEPGGSEKARIDSSGNFILNGTSANSANTITLNRGGGTPYIWADSTSNPGLYVNRRSTTGTLIDLYYDSVSRGSISTNGTTISYNTSSDYRLKEDIQPMTGALAFVRKQRPVTYKWKADGSEGAGYIAHWMQEDGAGNCVTGEKDAVDAEGNPQYQGIDTSFMVAPLNAAINELAEIVEAQAAIIEQLKADVAALKAAA